MEMRMIFGQEDDDDDDDDYGEDDDDDSGYDSGNMSEIS